MLDEDQLEEAIRDIIIDICAILYERGYDSIPVGAVMRLVGVAKEQAVKHDDELLVLDEDFAQLIKEKKKLPVPKRAPSGVTLH